MSSPPVPGSSLTPQPLLPQRDPSHRAARPKAHPLPRSFLTDHNPQKDTAQNRSPAFPVCAEYQLPAFSPPHCTPASLQRPHEVSLSCTSSTFSPVCPFAHRSSLKHCCTPRHTEMSRTLTTEPSLLAPRPPATTVLAHRTVRSRCPG